MLRAPEKDDDELKRFLPEIHYRGGVRSNIHARPLPKGEAFLLTIHMHWGNQGKEAGRLREAGLLEMPQTLGSDRYGAVSGGLAGLLHAAMMRWAWQ